MLETSQGRLATNLQSLYQQTLARPFERVGVGLHSGNSVCLRVLPAPAGSGRYFVRTDLPDRPQIPARIDRVGQTLLSTELGDGAAAVRTVEHLLAALSGMGIDNAAIELDALEVPLLDGSALPWVEAIEQSGIVAQAAERPQWEITEPITVSQGDAFVAAFPANELRFTYGIDFDLEAIGNQWQSWSPDRESFAETIAPARTFGIAEQIEYLRQQGLIKGGSLDNALVCSRDGWINPPLRFSNEPVRHKLLDLVGDLSLLGAFPRAHILAYKASHQLHTQFAARLAPLLPS
ncbi:UDP-3-O-acyl-N-acetylglucosamine deacetylase [Leptolyngbya ohadii]|uniref:UDP-3-O-acyl-N-acetylglucosamine deacetylase n=1 Tax=Leptolyngbya ohadii TaxID=1962290 RepID=UPI000B59BECD|nr:UDP-3-O-acyl-N-acetylglucosamine deacetylase [Leptolyngbya ohadii]